MASISSTVDTKHYRDCPFDVLAVFQIFWKRNGIALVELYNWLKSTCVDQSKRRCALLDQSVQTHDLARAFSRAWHRSRELTTSSDWSIIHATFVWVRVFFFLFSFFAVLVWKGCKKANYLNSFQIALKIKPRAVLKWNT